MLLCFCGSTNSEITHFLAIPSAAHIPVISLLKEHDERLASATRLRNLRDFRRVAHSLGRVSNAPSSGATIPDLRSSKVRSLSVPSIFRRRARACDWIIHALGKLALSATDISYEWARTGNAKHPYCFEVNDGQLLTRLLVPRDDKTRFSDRGNDFATETFGAWISMTFSLRMISSNH